MERPMLNNMSGRLRGLTRGWSRLGIRDHGRGIARIVVPDYPSASSVALRSAGPSRSVTCGSPASPPPTWLGPSHSLGSPTTRRTGPRGTRAMRSGSTGRGYFPAPGDDVGQGSRVDSRAVGTGCERVLDGGGAPARSAVQDGPRGGTASEERRRVRESLMRFNQSSDGRLARSGGPSGAVVVIPSSCRCRLWVPPCVWVAHDPRTATGEARWDSCPGRAVTGCHRSQLFAPSGPTGHRSWSASTRIMYSAACPRDPGHSECRAVADWTRPEVEERCVNRPTASAGACRSEHAGRRRSRGCFGRNRLQRPESSREGKPRDGAAGPRSHRPTGLRAQ